MKTPRHNIATQFADAYFVLDFDRCIGNTDVFHALLEQVIEEQTGISSIELRRAKNASERIGESFDTIVYVRHMLNESGRAGGWHDIQQEFIMRAQATDTLEPFARELFTLLDTHHIPYGIVTYGDEAWQLAKLEAAGLLEVPHIVTRIKEKGMVLSGWKHEAGFIIPPALTRDYKPLTVESIIFLDDKAVSFQGMPEGVWGVHVLSPTGEVRLSQQGTVPEGVTAVQGLGGALEVLFGQATKHQGTLRD